jgi:hypothetical protein
MDADAVFDASLGRQAGVALDHAVLHFDRATHRVDHAAKLDDDPVASPFDDARPWRAAIVGSMRSLRSALSRARVPSSSADLVVEMLVWVGVSAL